MCLSICIYYLANCLFYRCIDILDRDTTKEVENKVKKQDLHHYNVVGDCDEYRRFELRLIKLHTTGYNDLLSISSNVFFHSRETTKIIQHVFKPSLTIT